MDKIPYIAGGALLTIVVLVLSSAIASRVFVMRSRKRLLQSIGKESLPAYSPELVRNLPMAVQRYLNYALKNGTENIRYAVIDQSALFRHREQSPWMKVYAKEVISGMEPGFIWDAVLRHGWYWWRAAKLGYFQRAGHGHIKLFGAMTLEEFSGDETDTSMLFRFLSELIWVPTGLLPTKTLRWHHVDDNTARATITDGKTSVSALFHVNETGEIDKITTTDKFRDHKSGFEQQEFTLTCKEWKEVEGVRIPFEVRFAWNGDKGDFEYGIFTVDSIHYHYS